MNKNLFIPCLCMVILITLCFGCQTDSIARGRTVIHEKSAIVGRILLVPNVEGMYRVSAKKKIEGAGFRCRVIYREKSSVPEGRVIRQSPTAGWAYSGLAVKLFVSGKVPKTE